MEGCSISALLLASSWSETASIAERTQIARAPRIDDATYNHSRREKETEREIKKEGRTDLSQASSLLLSGNTCHNDKDDPPS